MKDRLYMNRHPLRRLNLILWAAAIVFSFSPLVAFVSKVSVLVHNGSLSTGFPAMRMVLLSDNHAIGDKNVNRMQMENFLINIEMAAKKYSQKFCVIVESPFFDNIELNNESEESLAQKFYDAYRFFPNVENNLMPNFDAAKTNLSFIDPNAYPITTWMNWDFPVKYTKERKDLMSSVSVIALDPRQKIYNFAIVFCEYLNKTGSNIPIGVSLEDIYSQLKLLIKKFNSMSKSFNFYSPMISYKEKKKQLEMIKKFFGNKKKRKVIYPCNIMNFIQSKDEMTRIQTFFGIKNENGVFKIDPDLLVSDDYLGKDTLEFSIIVAIFNRIAAQKKLDAQNGDEGLLTFIVLVGGDHVKYLTDLLLRYGFNCKLKFPDSEKKKKMSYLDFINLFNDFSITLK